MFGYVKPFQPELKVHELEVYKSIYCGLCKQIGRSYSQTSRLILSYDMTFLALVGAAVQNDHPGFKKSSCPAHVFQKRNYMISSSALCFAADIAVLFAYYKLRDALKDDFVFKRTVLLPAWPALAHAKKQAQNAQPKAAQIIKDMTLYQQQTEQQNASLDQACDPTATALSQIAGMLCKKDSLAPAFERMGYMLGRYIYLMDAIDDLNSDIKANRFNPFALHFHLSCLAYDNQKVISYAEELLNVTIAQLAAAYELLPFKRYKSILDNIIYLGLKNRQMQLLHPQNLVNSALSIPTGEKKNEQSI